MALHRLVIQISYDILIFFYFQVGALICVPVVVMSGGSLFWLLSIGDHIIQVPDDVIVNPRRSWCGLIPLGQPSTVSTTGLKWNLGNNGTVSVTHILNSDAEEYY